MSGLSAIVQLDGLPIDSHYRTTVRFAAGQVEIGRVEVTKDLAVPSDDDTGAVRLPEGKHDLRMMLLPTP